MVDSYTILASRLVHNIINQKAEKPAAEQQSRQFGYGSQGRMLFGIYSYRPGYHNTQQRGRELVDPEFFNNGAVIEKIIFDFIEQIVHLLPSFAYTSVTLE